MNKVADTYWNNSQTITMTTRTRKAAAPRANTSTPHWFLFVVVAAVFFMICLAVNIRAVSEMNAEAEQNSQLSTNVEKLSVENLALQEEIHNLKNDDGTIEREARKIGMSRPNEKFLVPTN